MDNVLVKCIFRFLNLIIPKIEHQICLSAFPDYDDMVRAFLMEIRKNPNGKYRVVILAASPQNPPVWAQRERVVHLKKYSMRGFWAYFRSRFVFFTHGCFSTVMPVKNQLTVNLWHGMPIKKIGAYINSKHPVPFADYALATSPFFADVMARAFAMKNEQVLNIGLPRNDVLFLPQNEALYQALGRGKKIITWLPTYRQSIVGDIRQDGLAETNVFNLVDLDIEELNRAFGLLGVVAVIKPHPMAAKKNKESDFSGYQNIKFIDEEWLVQNNTTLGEVLSLSSALITDTSSVLIDYLLLNRPIICHFPDIEEYRTSRGFIFEVDFKQCNIPIVETQFEIISSLRTALGDLKKNKPSETFSNFSHTQKFDFTKSLFQLVGIKMTD